MLEIFKKKEPVIDSYNVTETDGAEVWMVYWNARYGNYSCDYKHVAKAFLSKKDAERFCETLNEAQKLLQYTENINIQIEKQE